MFKPAGNDGETEYVAAPPVFVAVVLVIAVPTVAAIVDVDKVIEGAFT
jgi:hypothetical protein